MAVFQLEARELEPEEPFPSLPTFARRRRTVHADASADGAPLVPALPPPLPVGDVLTCDEIGAVLVPSIGPSLVPSRGQYQAEPESEVRIRHYYEREVESLDPDEVPLPALRPPPPMVREGLAIAWMDRRDALAARGVTLRCWVEAQPLASLTGRRIEHAVAGTENILRALDGLAMHVAASAPPEFLARHEVLDALTSEVHGLVELVLAEIEELAVDHESGYEPWGTAGRAFAEHAAMHVLAHVEPRVVALEARCGLAVDGAPVLLRVAGAAAWLRRAVVQLTRELRARAA